MFFHIDESGNSGNNLFDKNQPILSYGVLSSTLNVDVLGRSQHERILRKLGVESLHANQLKADGLIKVASDLRDIQEKFQFRFDYYFVDKTDFSIAMLFDAVFDAGLNDAVKWDWYWTPLRYPLIAALSSLLDEGLLKEAWQLRLMSRPKLQLEQGRVVILLQSILDRLKSSDLDKRAAEILADGLMFGIQHPLRLDFATDNPKSLSPNAVCFQFVLSCIAGRQKSAKRRAMGITVDVQSEFNPAQIQTFYFHSKIAEAFKQTPADKKWYLEHPLHEGAREDANNLINNFPTEKLTIARSKDSPGLQIVDVYLWLANRAVKDLDLPPELVDLAGRAMRSSRIDGISIPGMMKRWEIFEQRLPQVEDISPEIHSKNAASVERHRTKVRDMNLDPK